MRGPIVLLLLFALVISGCTDRGKPVIAEDLPDSMPDESDAIQADKPDENQSHTEFMIPSDYESLTRNIGILADMGGEIGPAHYAQLQQAVDNLEKNGADVSILRDHLARLKVARDGPHRETDNNSSQGQIKMGILSPRGCEGKGLRMLGASPLALDDLQKILPMGMMSSVHITPTDHQYWHTLNFNGPSEDTINTDRFKIHAPADGFVVEIGKVFDQENYRIIIEHSCNFYTIFIHIDKLAEKLLKEMKNPDGSLKLQEWPRIPVKEGEVIGSIGIGKFDFSVVDESVTLQGFANPKTYEAEVWKIHTADTFDYYSEPLRSKLLAKNVKASEPFGGKIDYDIPGKLIGSWFRENTNGYKGLGNENYWTSHLSIAYDILDPNQIVVSIGDFDGEGRQYGVKGNAPKPQDITAETGIVKYELVPYDYYSGNTKWDGIKFTRDITAKNTNEVRGVALFQLIDGKLKAEFFPNKSGSKVNGFTRKEIMYER